MCFIFSGVFFFGFVVFSYDLWIYLHYLHAVGVCSAKTVRKGYKEYKFVSPQDFVHASESTNLKHIKNNFQFFFFEEHKDVDVS